MEGRENCNQCLEHTGQIERIDAIKEAIDTVHKQQIVIVQGQVEIHRVQTEQGMKIEFMDDKLDKMDHLTEAVVRMSMAIEASTDENKRSTEEMKQSMAKMFEVLTAHGTRMDGHEELIKDIQAIPAKNALKLIDVVKGIFITTFVGGFALLLWDKILEVWRS